MKVESARLESILGAPTTVLGLEGEQTLKLKERVTKLFDELHLPVYRYLLWLTMSPTETDEIIQETFLRLYQHLNSGGNERNLRGWIFRVAHNLCINELKGRKRVASTASEDLPALDVSVADSRPGPEELLLQREKIARIHAAVSSLSEQQKQCLLLRAEGFRYREIAAILEVTISTVAESLRRAIKKLTKESDG